MKILKFFPVMMLFTALFFTGCAPKDSDIKVKVEEKLKTNQETAGTMVMVNDGIATLSGEVSNDNAKAESERIAKDTKGVKSVVNNITVALPAPPAAPVVINADNDLNNGVRDATKDYPSVTASVNDGVIVLTGDINKNDLPKLMQALNSLKPKKIDNNLTVK